MTSTRPEVTRPVDGAICPATTAGRLIGAILVFGVAASLFLQSWRYGLMVTVSFGLHELGHILVLTHYRIPWEIKLSLLGVATVTPRAERQRLSHYANSQIHLAGPLMSLAQALVALAGYGLSGADKRSESWLLVANLGALLSLLNLLPLGRLSDGGKFIRRLFTSLTEQAEESVIWSLLLWLLSIAWLIAVNWGDTLRTLGSLAVAVWFVAATLIERRRDDPRDAVAKRSMTRRQGILLFSVTATALLWATGLSVLTPFWLTPEHIERMAFHIAAVLILLQRADPVATGLVCLGPLVIAALILLRKRS